MAGAWASDHCAGAWSLPMRRVANRTLLSHFIAGNVQEGAARLRRRAVAQQAGATKASLIFNLYI
jgi:hypothetical protein